MVKTVNMTKNTLKFILILMNTRQSCFVVVLNRITLFQFTMHKLLKINFHFSPKLYCNVGTVMF